MFILYPKEMRTEEVTEYLRALAALAEDPSSVFTSGRPEPFVTTAPGDLMPSSDFQRPLHTHDIHRKRGWNVILKNKQEITVLKAEKPIALPSSLSLSFLIVATSHYSQG